MKAGMLTLSSGLLVVRDEDVGSVAAAAQKEALSFLLAGGHLSLLGAMLALALFGAPLAAAAALRISLD